jgi:hypothetical protein
MYHTYKMDTAAALPEYSVVKSIKVHNDRRLFRIPYIVNTSNGARLNVYGSPDSIKHSYIIPTGKHLLNLRYASFVDTIIIRGSDVTLDVVILKEFPAIKTIVFPNLKSDDGKALAFRDGYHDI